MFFRKIIALCAVWWLFVANLNAQTPDIWRDIMEKYTENQEQEADYQDLLELLQRLSENKINLNKANSGELRALFFLTSEQILAIEEHIQRFGPLISLHELQVIDAMDEESIRLLLPFVSVDAGIWEPVRFRDLKAHGRHDLIQQLESDRPLSAGYLAGSDTASPAFEGSPERWVTRYRYAYKDRIQVGWSAEKDAGEPFNFQNGRFGYDFHSAFLSYRGKGTLQYAVIGDYQVSFGQCLTIGTGLAFGKSAAVTMTRRNFNGIRPYKSVNENSFMRGAAIQFGNQKITGTLFYSRLRQDGSELNSDSISNDAEAQIGAINLTGLHRTATEQARKGNLVVQSAGFQIQYKKRNFLLGITSVLHDFSVPLEPSQKNYNQFYERGDLFGKVGFYYDRHFRNLNLYGESSIDQNGATAHVHGLLLSLGKALDMNVFYRNYSRNFTALYSNGIGENSLSRNEEGIYLGIQYKLNRYWQLSGYYDIFRFPWIRYQSESPSAGKEYLAELQFRPSKKSLLYFRLRTEQKADNLTDEGTVESRVAQGTRTQYRFHAEYPAGDFLRLKTRAEWSFYQKGGKTVHGSMIFQDIQLKPANIPLSFVFRTALFEVEEYDARIYAFENDVPYSFSVAMLQNSGVRNYLMVRWHVKKGLDIWGRAYSVHYSGLSSIGSGTGEIEGNRKSGISLLVKYSF